MTAILRITDGTTTISLLNGDDGFFLNHWRPAIPQYKGGGVFQSSPLADGRRLVARQFDNAIETFDLKLHSGSDQDDLIFITQELRRLLEKAVDYWATSWQDEPVWIEAQATCETNLRYALIHSYSTPDDDNPFAQPFLQFKGAAMDNWILILERGHWLADQPGTGTCVEVSGTQTDSYVEEIIYYPLISTDDAFVDDIGAILTGSAHMYFGDLIDVDYDLGIRFRNVSISQGATIASAFVRFTAHNDANAVTCNATILGEDYSQPAAFSTWANFVGRTRTSANVAWNDVGAWVQGNTYDTPDITTIIQEVVNRADWVSGNDIVIFVQDNSSSVNANRIPAAIDNPTYDEPELHIEHWGRTAGRTATCEDEVYIANKQNKAQLTNVYVDNGGVWGGNLIGAATPFNLLPAVPAVGDAIYFGIDTTGADSGPFSSLVFDIATAIADVTTIVWEYWNGAWVVVPNIQDNTDADGAMTGVVFDTTGVKSVHWLQRTDWATRDISADGGPAVTGYWVRARVTAIGAAPTAPTQQNRDIYTITWPFFETAAAQVAGDIPAIIRVRLRNQADNNAGAWAFNVLAGLRSNSRGTDFAAFINLANEQNPSGVTVAHAGTGTLTADADAPTGVLLRVINPGAAWATVATIAFDETIAPQYAGEYHSYLRVDQKSGAAGDLRFRLWIQYAIGGTDTSAPIILGPWYLNKTTSWSLIDMGQIKLPPQIILPTDSFELLLSIQIYGNGASDVDIYDFIVMPIDECAVQMLDIGNELYLGDRNMPTTLSSYLDMDNLTLPKIGLQGLVRNYAQDRVMGPWATRANTDFILQANADQRVYFLNIGTDTNPIAYPNNANSLYVVDNERYLSMRGAR